VETVIRTRAADIRSGFIAEDARKLRRIVDHYAARCGRRTYASLRCNVPYVSAVIEADGGVRPCFFHRRIGNVNDAPLADVLNSPEMAAFRKTLNVQEDPICRRCVCPLYYRAKRSEPLATKSAS
jgi:MoaA/NifB/PqqE/SkfB family radical SAM enzyme